VKTKHLTQKDLAGHTNNTLDDAHREIMDAHLLECQICRANLSAHQDLQRQISNQLNAVLKSASPSSQMNFDAVSLQMQTQYSEINFWPRLAGLAPAALALVGLFLAIFGLWQAVTTRVIFSSSTQSLEALPTLSCFFLILASVGQFDHTSLHQVRFFFTWALTLILWLGSIVIGLLNLIAIRDLAIMAVMAFNGSAADAILIAIIAVLIGAIIFIGIVIGGGEYHYRNIGQPASWKLFTLTLMGQLLLLIIPYLIW
jgi:hypothetical protein